MDCPKFKKIIINLFLIITFLSFGFCFDKSVNAQEENSGLRIFYQGNLLDSEGKPVENENYNMRFSIYDAETDGSILWQEEYAFYNAISVKSGQFRIILGRTKPINLKIDEGPFWLEVSVGSQTENDEIIWNLGTEQRKKIMSLSDFLEEEGLDYLKEDGLTEEEWEEIYQLLEKKLKEQPNLVFLLDLEQIETNGTSSGSQLFDVLRTFINFISEKISEIGDKISEIGGKIDEILKKIEEITSALLNIGEKIDRLYQVLVADKGLGPEELPSEFNETKNYTSQKFERMTIKTGESSIRIFNQSVKAESLIFVSFLDDPGSSWWISERVPEDSFVISLKEPALQDLRFDYWILDSAGETTEEEIQQPEEPPAQSPEDNEAGPPACETCGGEQAEEPGQEEEEEQQQQQQQQVESATTSSQAVEEEVPPILPEEQGEEQSSATSS